MNFRPRVAWLFWRQTVHPQAFNTRSAYVVSSPAVRWRGAKLVDEVDDFRGFDSTLMFFGVFFRLVPKIPL
jgi:hypothetical protein